MRVWSCSGCRIRTAAPPFLTAQLWPRRLFFVTRNKQCSRYSSTSTGRKRKPIVWYLVVRIIYSVLRACTTPGLRLRIYRVQQYSSTRHFASLVHTVPEVYCTTNQQLYIQPVYRIAAVFSKKTRTNSSAVSI